VPQPPPEPESEWSPDDPTKWTLSYLNGDVRVMGQFDSFGLDEVLSVLVRRVPDFESFRRAVAPQYAQYEDYIAHQQFSLFSDCLAVLDATKPFVNPLATATRAHKAVQARLASQVGLCTPETYIGANPTAARNFCEQLFNENLKVCTKPINNKKVCYLRRI
jgi:hypothetical protein